jgi:hypothetical protein
LFERQILFAGPGVGKGKVVDVKKTVPGVLGNGKKFASAFTLGTISSGRLASVDMDNLLRRERGDDFLEARIAAQPVPVLLELE